VCVCIVNENYYFVTGLPRSRTAWLANWLTAPGTFCFHDATLIDNSHVGVLSVMAERQNRRQYEAVGDSDSGLIFWSGQVRAACPKAPFILIERDPEACLASSLRLGFSKGLWDAILQAYWQTRRLPGVRIVSYDSLDDIDVLDSLYYDCTGLPMDRQRTELLQHLNVQEILNNGWPSVKGAPELHVQSA